jgi:hypothetical protein
MGVLPIVIHAAGGCSPAPQSLMAVDECDGQATGIGDRAHL